MYAKCKVRKADMCVSCSTVGYTEMDLLELAGRILRDSMVRLSVVYSAPFIFVDTPGAGCAPLAASVVVVCPRW